MNLEYVRAWVTWRPFSLPDRAVPRSFCHTPISFSSSSGGHIKKFYHFWSAPLGPLAGSGPNQNKSSRALSLLVTQLILEKKTFQPKISKTYVTLNNFLELCGQQRAMFEIFAEGAGSLCLSSLTGLLCKWEKRGDCRVSDYWPTFCLQNYKYRRLSKTLNFEIFANTLNKTVSYVGLKHVTLTLKESNAV